MKYSASFKLQVVKFASDNSNNSAASRKFGIDEKLVRDWRRKIDNIKSLPKTKCADRGRKCQWPELEKKVVEWVEENRKSGLAVTRNLICLFKQAIQGSFTGKMDDLDDEWGKDIHTGWPAPSSISRNSLSMG